jgi:hypothetical protein
MLPAPPPIGTLVATFGSGIVVLLIVLVLLKLLEVNTNTRAALGHCNAKVKLGWVAPQSVLIALALDPIVLMYVLRTDT